NAIHDPWPKRIGMSSPFLPLGQRHKADGALFLGIVPHHGGMHGAEPFRRRVARSFGSRRTSPLLIVSDEQVPLRNDQADDDQNGDETEPGQLDQNYKVKPPP